MTTAKIVSDFEPLTRAVKTKLTRQNILLSQLSSDYLVCLNLQPRLKKAVVTAIKSHSGKAVVVLQNEKLVKELQEQLSQTKAVIKYVFLGELFDEENLYGDLEKFAQEINEGQIKSFAPTDQFFLVSLPQAAEFVVRELFTYAHAQELLYASKIKAADLLSLCNNKIATQASFLKHDNQYRKQFGNAHLIDPGLQTQMLLHSFIAAQKQKETKLAPSLPRLTPLPDTSSQPFASAPLKVAPPQPSHRKSIFYQKYFYLAILPLWFFIFPFLLFFAGAATTYLDFELLKKGRLQSAARLVSLSAPLTHFSTLSLQTLSRLPLAGAVFVPTAQTSQLLGDVNEVLILGFEIADNLQALKAHILNEKTDQDFEHLSRDIYYQISEAEKSVAYLLAEQNNFLLSSYIDEPGAQEVLQLFASVRKLAFSLPDVLGGEEPREYLVLLQNNMELRPTGGFIGSFALVRFEKGRLVDSQIYDVYSADGQLKGYVRPPEPISTYLGEESWFLRDSNWDPDFEVTARRAAWFLDKSMDRQVDGVVAVNLNLIAEVLNVIGPVDLIDFGDQISTKNIFTKLQSEVEEDFFPGSRKKAHYLTDFSEGFLHNLQVLTAEKSLVLGRVLAERFLAKDLQFAFLQSPRLSSSVLGVSTEKEVEGKIQFVEANLGVNKVNLYITRRARAWIDVGPNQTRYIYEITLENHSPNTNPPQSTYGVYARILAARDARFEKIKIESDSMQKTVFPEIKQVGENLEAGVFVRVEGKTKKKLRFVWTEGTDQNFSQPGKFDFRLVKQSGVEPYPVELNFQFPVKLSLTGYPSVSYNTLLNKDQVFEISWD